MVDRRLKDILKLNSLPKKVAASFVCLSALAGCNYALCQLALHYYCLCQGVRLPFEGLPFFAALLALVSAIGWILFHTVNLVFFSLFDWAKFIGEKWHELTNSKGYRLTLVAFLAVSALVLWGTESRIGLIALTGAFSLVFTDMEKEDKPYQMIFPCMGHTVSLACFVTCFFVPVTTLADSAFFWATAGSFVLGLGPYVVYAWYPNYDFAIASIFAFVCVLIGNFVLLSDPHTVADLLSVSKYGGGIDVVIAYEESGGATTKAESQGELIMRTQDSLFIRTNDTIEEFPLQHVRSITYPQKK